jgi:hypothetical protein
MTRTQLVVLSVLSLGLAGAVQASPFPADAEEANYNKPALDTYADQQARAGNTWGVNARSESVFPADAEASYDKPALSSYAEQYARKPNSALEMRSQTALPYTVQIADG